MNREVYVPTDLEEKIAYLILSRDYRGIYDYKTFYKFNNSTLILFWDQANENRKLLVLLKYNVFPELKSEANDEEKKLIIEVCEKENYFGSVAYIELSDKSSILNCKLVTIT